MIGLTMIALVLALPSIGRAHEGHLHKVMGTVSSIDGQNLTVKTTDGKTVTVTLNAKTKITQGKNKIDASAVKVGNRVVAEGMEAKDVITAASLRVGETSPDARK